MVLAENRQTDQTDKQIKEIKSPEINPHNESTNIWERSKGNIKWTREESFQQIVLKQLDMQTYESRHRPYTLNKNEQKMIHRPKCKMQNYKILRW